MTETAQRIFRAPTLAEKTYFQVRFDTAQDNDLTWEARGLLIYLLSKPANWQVQITDLRQNCGRDKVYKILKELREHGYVKYIEERDDLGRVTDTYYTVHEVPFTESPETAKQDTENQELTNKEKSTNKRVKESAVAALGDVPEKIVDNSPVKEKKQKPQKQEKTEQDQLFEIIALGSFGKPYQELNGNSARAGKIRKEILKLKPDITPEYLKAGYQLYLKENPDIKHNPKNRLKSPMAIIDKCEQAYDLANRGKPTPKVPEQVIIPADYVAPDLKAISKRIEEEYKRKRELERGQQSK